MQIVSPNFVDVTAETDDGIANTGPIIRTISLLESVHSQQDLEIKQARDLATSERTQASQVFLLGSGGSQEFESGQMANNKSPGAERLDKVDKIELVEIEQTVEDIEIVTMTAKIETVGATNEAKFTTASILIGRKNNEKMVEKTTNAKTMAPETVETTDNSGKNAFNGNIEERVAVPLYEPSYGKQDIEVVADGQPSNLLVSLSTSNPALEQEATDMESKTNITNDAFRLSDAHSNQKTQSTDQPADFVKTDSPIHPGHNEVLIDQTEVNLIGINDKQQQAIIEEPNFAITSKTDKILTTKPPLQDPTTSAKPSLWQVFLFRWRQPRKISKVKQPEKEVLQGPFNHYFSTDQHQNDNLLWQKFFSKSTDKAL